MIDKKTPKKLNEYISGRSNYLIKATTVLSSVVSYFLIRLIRSNDDFQEVLYVISNEDDSGNK